MQKSGADMGLRTMTESVVAPFYASGAWQDRTLYELVAEQAARHPEKAAVVDQHDRWMYDELMRRVAACATWLLDQGFTPGAVVAVQSANRVHLPLMHLACNRAGFTFLPLSTAWREQELRHLLALSEAEILVVPGTLHDFNYFDLAQRIRSELPALRAVGTIDETGADFSLEVVSQGTAGDDASRGHLPDEPRFIMVTSGTTDLPRMSQWTDNNLWFFMREYIRAVELTDADTTLGLAPAGTGATGYVYPVLAPLLVGATSVLLEEWSVEGAFDALAAEAATVGTAIPTQLVKMVQDPRADTVSFPALRVFTNAGAPLPATTGPEVQSRFGCTLQTCYGASDGGVPVLTSVRDTDQQRFRTVGQVLPHTDLRLVDGDLTDVPEGEPGEVLWRSPTKHLGYLNEPERTEAAFWGDGWYRSGDLGVIEDGYLSIVGRVKDVIIRGGQNISPREVEDLVGSHPAVATVGVIGVPDAVYGERVCACVVLKDGASLELPQLLRHLESTGVAKFKWPERLEILDRIPESAGGKQSKVELRRLVLERA